MDLQQATLKSNTRRKTIPQYDAFRDFCRAPSSLLPEQVVDLWLLAAHLQLAGPRAAAEAALPAALQDAPAVLPAALAAATAAGPAGPQPPRADLVYCCVFPWKQVVTAPACRVVMLGSRAGVRLAEEVSAPALRLRLRGCSCLDA